MHCLSAAGSWRCARERESARAAPVVPDEMKRLQLQLLAHLTQIGADALFVVALGRRALAQSGQVGRDHPIVVGEERNHLAPFVPGLGPAMQQQERSATAGGDNVQRYARELEPLVLESCQTTAPSCSSRRPLRVGLMNCSRFAPSHMTSGLATSTEE